MYPTCKASCNRSLFGGSVEFRQIWTTPLSKEELIAQLRGLTEPVSEFRLVSKLSGAGIVVRALEMPETDKPLIGRVSEREIKVAQHLETVNVSPYQPLIVIEYRAGTLELTFKPHKDVYLLSALEWVGGLLCIVSGLVGMTQNPLALLAVVVGAALIALPRLRARWNFQRELHRVQEALKTLPIDWTASDE